MAMRAVVVSGAGRYADPWHPFRETSQELATIVRAEGHEVRLVEDVDAQLADLTGVDLLLVNVGAPGEGVPVLDASTRAGLLAHLRRGGALLSLHAAATSFPAVPEWEAMHGGTWVRGTTMHPAYGPSSIVVHADRHPLVADIDDFEVHDERYSYLRTDPAVVPLLTHWHDEIEHPLLWTWGYGAARVVYDALGHDAQSYRSPEHREILGRGVRWLLHDRV